MNAAKSLATVLYAAVYTSAWWAIAIFNKDAHPAMILAHLVAVFGTVGIVAICWNWFVDNWNEK